MKVIKNVQGQVGTLVLISSEGMIEIQALGPPGVWSELHSLDLSILSDRLKEDSFTLTLISVDTNW